MTVSLLPREHGAYGQMALPLVTSFAVAGVTRPALLVALATVAGFLSHEPLLALAGLRGARAGPAERRRAARWLTVTGAIAVGSGLAAIWAVPPAIRWWFLLPVAPALIVAAAIAARREKSVVGEVAVALTFSLVAVPICLAAQASIGTALAVGLTFASIFVAGSLAVRVIVLEVRGGGNPQAARATRATVLLVTAAAGLGLVALVLRALLPWITLFAAVPGLSGAVWLAVFPPSPARLRMVGWTLVTTSAAAALVLVIGLAGER